MDLDAAERARHLKLLNVTSDSAQPDDDVKLEEIRTTPLFGSTVQSALRRGKAGREGLHGAADSFPQYGLLGLREGTSNRGRYTPANLPQEDNMVYANMNAPWSAFICGSQGSGKSHTLSCLLENSLLSPSQAGKLPNPLAALVFHYDRYTSTNTTQICEAAYLCSAGVPVQVLVSPSNYHNMARLYSELPGLGPHVKRPVVTPLYLQERQLNITNIKTLMAVSNGSGSTPLYLEVLFQLLRDMAEENQGRPGVDYRDFKNRLDSADFSRDQKGPLKLRLQLLESFLDVCQKKEGGIKSDSSSNSWDFAPGSLTIVDFSDPFINESDACALFSICLTLFMETRGQAGRIIALDEAHKFLTQSGEALNFTKELVSIIRQQRHLATRIVVATQEPTLSSDIIQLCNLTIVHRFLSPAWYEKLKKDLAGARSDGHETDAADIFRTIVSLPTGTALVFCPTALVEVGPQLSTDSAGKPLVKKLGDSYIKLRIRNRVTADGGKSIMASDSMKAPPLEADLKHESEYSRSESSISFRSGKEFNSPSKSSSSEAQPSARRSCAGTQEKAQQPAAQTQHKGKQQPVQSHSQQSPRQQPVESHSQQSPHQQPAEKGKQAIVRAPNPLPPPQVDVQSLTKKPKKASKPKVPVQKQPQKGAKQLTKKQRQVLRTGVLPLTNEEISAVEQGTLRLTKGQRQTLQDCVQQRKMARKQEQALQQGSQ